MLPGPNIILKVPGCEKPVKIESAISGNTFGSVLWSDGQLNAPMLLRNPLIMKSPSEGVFFWLRECKKIGEEEYYSPENLPPWGSVEFAGDVTEDEYFSLLETPHAKEEKKQIYLRTRLWWEGNDHIRWEQAKELPEKHHQNLRELLGLLEKNGRPKDLLTRAEILRELSRFDEALDLLKLKKGKDYVQLRPLIRELAERQDPLVAVVHSGSLRFERGAHGPIEKKKRRRHQKSHSKDFE